MTDENKQATEADFDIRGSLVFVDETGQLNEGSICGLCGAVVEDQYKHEEWHKRTGRRKASR